MTRRGYLWTALAGGCALLGGFVAIHAQEEAAEREALIKAGYLYNFAIYTQWPKNAAGGDTEKFYIGILGKGDLSPSLKKLAAAKSVQGKPIVLYHFSSIKDYKPCHLLFIAAEPAGNAKESAQERLAAALKKTKGQPVLVVTESAGLAQKGATVNFYIEDNLVKFEINLDAAKGANVQIHPKVLGLGKIIRSPEK
jgi:hypothetical protein